MKGKSNSTVRSKAPEFNAATRADHADANFRPPRKPAALSTSKLSSLNRTSPDATR
jgi:hypothetical protein